METKQNMQKGIRNLLKRIITVLIIVTLYFHVCDTPKVLAAEEQELDNKTENEEVLNNTAITGAIEKLETLEVSKNMDISQVMGFTAEELELILLNGRDTQGNILVTDYELARELAESIVEAVKLYPVNEMCVISIMSFETGHFTSSAVVKHNNYAGDKFNGQIMHFETDAEGISKGVMYIYDNMIATGPTIRDINMRYCEIDPPPEEETKQEEEARIYKWSNKVVSVMRMYTKIREGE